MWGDVGVRMDGWGGLDGRDGERLGDTLWSGCGRGSTRLDGRDGVCLCDDDHGWTGVASEPSGRVGYTGGVEDTTPPELAWEGRGGDLDARTFWP